ncbi:hypothetical protein F5882DRAFT_454598 [Hyaloscypha sp. PMI_1271]|nr:hypothetical protein F5882DRAFT_454598 [Hyaloscypha sp. PMI_1271]
METTQYVDNAVASVMEGLTVGEREKVFLYVLFADTETGRHPSWKQPWLENSVDLAVGYNVSEEHRRPVYTVMFEDDIITAAGWMAKVRQSLDQIKKGAVTNPSLRDWLYLRLFYTETALSWEAKADYWYGHMAYTFLLASFFGSSLLIAPRFLVPRTQRYLDDPTIFVLSAITIPAFVVLAFVIGKYSLFPLRGVVTMNKQIPALIEHLRGIGAGQTDMMIEEYADQTGKQRLAMGNSRGNNFVDGQSTFAFWFEEYDSRRLEREHDELLGMGFD